MNILIVTAHPSALGETHKIANTYAEVKREKNNVVQIVDLYADEYKIENLHFTEIHNFTPSKVQIKFQEQLKWADEIVVVHPVWWGTPPSIMKSWVELAFWKGVAYRYSPKGQLEKLLLGKSAKVFATCGGPAWIYKLPLMPLRSFWQTSVFEFCGVDVVKIEICGNLHKMKDEGKRKKHIDTFLKKIKRS